MKKLKLITINDYAVVISDDEITYGVLIAKDGSGIVKVVRHDNISIRCVNVETGVEASILRGTQEKDWANVIATIDKNLTTEGIPMLEFLNRTCSNKDCGSTFRWKSGDKIATQCINCGSNLHKYPESVELDEQLNIIKVYYNEN